MQGGLKTALAIGFLSLAATLSGVYATWNFSESPASKDSAEVGVSLGEITFAPKETLHITAVELLSSHNAHNVSVHFTHPTYLATTVNATQAGGNVTYKVTVFNNTAVNYWYLGPSWQNDFEGNNLLGASGGISIATRDKSDDGAGTFNEEDWVPAYTTRDFYITYTFGANAVGAYVSNLLLLEFGVKMDSVHEQFLEVLNNPSEENGYPYIVKIFNERYKQDGSTTISNVGDDEKIFDVLFGGQPTVDIDGKAVPVTMTIRRDNVDDRTTGDSYDVAGGPKGCEYTIYMTIDALDSPTGEAIVYAVSYSSGGVGGTQGAWHQLGQLYEGTAPLTTYRGTDEVIFDITEWEATAKEYEFIGGKTYKVGYEQGDQYDKYKTLEEIMSANDQDVFNDIDNTGVLKKVYAVVYSSANVNKPGYEALRAAFEAAAPFYQVHNGGQDVKVRREATRAEILPYMIAIQSAYDYYLQVNP